MLFENTILYDFKNENYFLLSNYQMCFLVLFIYFEIWITIVKSNYQI